MKIKLKLTGGFLAFVTPRDLRELFELTDREIRRLKPGDRLTTSYYTQLPELTNPKAENTKGIKGASNENTPIILPDSDSSDVGSDRRD